MKFGGGKKKVKTRTRVIAHGRAFALPGIFVGCGLFIIWHLETVLVSFCQFNTNRSNLEEGP